MTVATLDELAAQPERVRELPSNVAADLLTKVIGLQTALLAQVLAGHAKEPSRIGAGEDRLLKVSEAATKLGTTPDWLYRHASELPFTVRNSRQLRFAERGIEQWITMRQGRAE